MKEEPDLARREHVKRDGHEPARRTISMRWRSTPGRYELTATSVAVTPRNSVRVSADDQRVGAPGKRPVASSSTSDNVLRAHPAMTSSRRGYGNSANWSIPRRIPVESSCDSCDYDATGTPDDTDTTASVPCDPTPGRESFRAMYATKSHQVERPDPIVISPTVDVACHTSWPSRTAVRIASSQRPLPHLRADGLPASADHRVAEHRRAGPPLVTANIARPGPRYRPRQKPPSAMREREQQHESARMSIQNRPWRPKHSAAYFTVTTRAYDAGPGLPRGSGLAIVFLLLPCPSASSAATDLPTPMRRWSSGAFRTHNCMKPKCGRRTGSLVVRHRNHDRDG